MISFTFEFSSNSTLRISDIYLSYPYGNIKVYVTGCDFSYSKLNNHYNLKEYYINKLPIQYFKI